jgi:hypothetical protein
VLPLALAVFFVGGFFLPFLIFKDLQKANRQQH